jgi:hypothetical protein
MKYFLSLMLLVASFSSFAHDELGYKENLRAIKVTCSKVSGWDNEGKCYRIGVQAVIDEQSYTSYAPKMCAAVSGWDNEGKCYRAIIDQLGTAHDKRVKSLCMKMSGWDNEGKCYRDYFSDFN